MKARITWKGEEGWTPSEDNPKQLNKWRDFEFEAGKPFETDNPHLIFKATNNKYYEVDMLEGEAPKEAPPVPGQTPVPPSKEGAQKPVPKPGEPSDVTNRGGAAPPAKPVEPAKPVVPPVTAAKK